VANQDVQDKLERATKAIRNGDLTTGRVLLSQVIRQDPDNETAWLWMVSVVDNDFDRRQTLERVLAINPNNERARAALERLNALQVREARPPVAEEAPPGYSPTPAGPPAFTDEFADLDERARRANNDLFSINNILIGSVLALLLLGAAFLFIQFVLPGLTAPPQISTPTSAPLVVGPTAEPTEAPTIPFEVVTTRELPTFAPTFTPTNTPTPLATGTPTATPFPLAEIGLLYTARDPFSGANALYRAQADGSGATLVLENVDDVVYSQTGLVIALVRPVGAADAPADGEADGEDAAPAEDRSEIFIARADNPQSAQQLTSMGGNGSHSPSFSPDDRQLVFVSDQDGDDELYLADLTTRRVTQLTYNDGIDRDPAWSPDGTRIAFAADRSSPSLTEIYMLTFTTADAAGDLTEPHDSGHNVVRVTNAQASSYQPAWSADGNWIVFASDRDGDGDIYISSPDGQRLRLLTFNDGPSGRAEDRNPAFVPDGVHIAFISNRDEERFSLFIMNLEGRSITRINNDGRVVAHASFQPLP
jgi:hypothetical protein